MFLLQMLMSVHLRSPHVPPMLIVSTIREHTPVNVKQDMKERHLAMPPPTAQVGCQIVLEIVHIIESGV